jgi:hypothetical protein
LRNWIRVPTACSAKYKHEGGALDAGADPIAEAARILRMRSGLYSRQKDLTLLAPLRFIWNATRGHRLAPWRSEYLRWRIETYSGKRAETLTAGSIFAFVWASRWELLSFLAWTGRVEQEARKRP